jgi:hypothetical protein
MDYYLAYESYFAGLLFYEYRGIQIYTETLNQRDPTGQLTQNYLDRYYTPNLSAEVDRFLIGAARLVIYSANLTTTNASDPLFQGGQDVLSRAQFFAIQTRDEDSFGMRAILLTTADALKPTGNPTPLVNLANPGKGLSFSASATILRVPEGTAYDLWDGSSSPTFNTFLGSSANWLLLQVNFGPGAPEDLGNGWNVQLADSVLPASLSPAFPVSNYDDGYHLVTTGTITYGLGLGWARLGGPQQFGAFYPGGQVNPSWGINSNSVAKVNESGNPSTTPLVTNDGWSDRKLSPGFQYDSVLPNRKSSYSTNINGVIQDERAFTYNGGAPLQAKARATFQANVFWGAWGVGDSSISIKHYAWIGLYDRTTNQWASYARWACENPNIHHSNVQFGTNGVVTVEYAVSLSPGHTYGWIIGVQSNTWIQDAYVTHAGGHNLDLRNMQSYLYLKGVTI